MPGFSQPAVDPLFRYYDPVGFYDEMFSAAGEPRQHYRETFSWLATLHQERFEDRRQIAPFSCPPHESAGRPPQLDLLPRILTRSEWDRIERGLTQRLLALEAFLRDLYGPQHILVDGPFPPALLYSSRRFRRDLVGVPPAPKVHLPVTAFNLVRDSATGDFLVLADHLRRPSGISCLLENRAAMARVFPELCRRHDILPVEDYPVALGRLLGSLAPHPAGDAAVVILTPGMQDPSYSEHTFLARQLGVELVEARDLAVDRESVCMKTIRGLTRIDVIYRLVDEHATDSLARRSDSLLGIPGLHAAFRAGDVAIANHPGSGIAADSSVYPFVPELIRYYLGEQPVLPDVETWHCLRPADLAYVLDNLERLVVKAVGYPDEYGILVGPTATRTTLRDFRDRLRADPSNYIAQPVIALSRCPAYDSRAGAMAPRHVDLRAFCLNDGRRVSVVPGGLTRVSLKAGSTVINARTCAGKDTWILRSDR